MKDKEQGKDMLKKAGKITAGLGKAFFHASIGIAKGAADASLGIRTRQGERMADNQMRKAVDALKNIGKDDSNSTIKAKDIPDIKDFKKD